MKNFLRKFHLVGSSSVESGRSSQQQESAPSPSGSTLSSISDWISSLTSRPSTASSDTSSHHGGGGSGARARVEGTTAPARVSTTNDSSSVTPSSQAGKTFSSYGSLEEEYQVQLAIALSVNQPVDPEVAEIEAVKRISLGLCPERSTTSQADMATYRYWAYNALSYDDSVVDGFYDVYGVACDPVYPTKMPSLVDLQMKPLSDAASWEVVLVNRLTDSELANLEKSAARTRAQCTGGPSALAQKIAVLVAEQMGGAVENDVDMISVWRTTSWELRTSLKSNILPLGYLQIGLARHRALLFKVLADSVGIPCRLVKGKHYTGVDEGAVNIIKDADSREYIIDLMGAPGALIPSDGPASEKNVPLNHDTHLGQRHHSEPADFENALAGAGAGAERRPGPSHGRSPSWTEGIGAPGARQTKAKDMSQYMIEAAKENPGLAQKLQDVLLESGIVAPPEFLAELSPTEPQQRSTDARPDLRRPSRVARVKERGKPPLLTKSPAARPDDAAAKDRLQRLKSVEGLGDRRPLECPMPYYQAQAAAPTVLTPVHENSFPANLIKNSPVAASAITAAVVASSMVVAAAKTDIGDGSLEVPITAAATATAAVVAATSAAVVLKSESGSGNSDKGGSGDSKTRTEESGSHSGSKKKNNSRESEGDAGDLENGRTGISKSDSILDVAEWEIPWGELRVGDRIGLGSYGEVYRGEWHGTEVAIKKFLNQDISGDALEEFITEVRLMRRMRHPNVVLFMGAVTRPPNLSIVTEFLPRGSLFKLIHRPSNQVDERRRLRMALDVAKGMNYLHSSTPMIVHRDLKSPNLLVDKNWVVKVCDFGLSRMKHHTFLSSKSQAGTPEWMAPEVLRNEPSNEKSDVYSFGVILWELATLQQPWHGMNSMQVVGAVGFQNRRLDIPADMDPAIAKIIQECWENDPALRPSFHEIMDSLRPFQRPVIPSQGEAGGGKQKQPRKAS
ncbi:probable serine/threonine-protein kinase SIS8 [Selaginella moellendorffii]|uniref:probable serine/threonine-protein kinase SIS8 n=1 Tax=Selaginella moellendorffii TaxID=88036 RepID=UPI000D1CDD9F|nr:probable serine/threonine-protein kinase SIS8 [Selaginella moellendorffii]|eukprot:XP_024515164.1 probable serine/threonine-protein kinase SIS8 [Selaginella moellendorffii]